MICIVLLNRALVKADFTGLSLQFSIEITGNSSHRSYQVYD